MKIVIEGDYHVMYGGSWYYGSYGCSINRPAKTPIESRFFSDGLRVGRRCH